MFHSKCFLGLARLNEQIEKLVRVNAIALWILKLRGEWKNWRKNILCISIQIIKIIGILEYRKCIYSIYSLRTFLIHSILNKDIILNSIVYCLMIFFFRCHNYSFIRTKWSTISNCYKCFQSLWYNIQMGKSHFKKKILFQ